MISPPNNLQPMVFNINNTHENNYVNHGVRSQTPETTGEECTQAGHVLAPTSPLRETKKTSKSSTTLNNLMGFPEGEDTNSLNKEIGTSSNGSHSPNKERDPEYTTDPNHPSIAVQKKKSSPDKGEESINMQHQYPVEIKSFIPSLNQMVSKST